MKRIKRLGETFRGEVIAVLCIRVFIEIWCYFEGSSISWDWEDTFMCLGVLVFAIVMTYLGDVLGEGFGRDIKELKEAIRSRREKKEA